MHPSVSPGLVACRPQARGSCASGYTGSATTFGPGRDDDERALGPGEDPDIPVHLPLPWWRVVQEPGIPRSLDPAKAFVDVDGAARSPAPAEIRQLAPDAMAPLAQQPSYYPGEGVWSSLLHQNSKRQFCTAPLVTMLREPPQESASRLDCCAERRLDLTTFRGLTLALQSCAVAWACDRRRSRHPRSHDTICASSRCTAGARG